MPARLYVRERRVDSWPSPPRNDGLQFAAGESAHASVAKILVEPGARRIDDLPALPCRTPDSRVTQPPPPGSGPKSGPLKKGPVSVAAQPKASTGTSSVAGQASKGAALTKGKAAAVVKVDPRRCPMANWSRSCRASSA